MKFITNRVERIYKKKKWSSFDKGERLEKTVDFTFVTTVNTYY